MRENIVFVQVCSGLSNGNDTFPYNRNIDPRRLGRSVEGQLTSHHAFLDNEVSPLVKAGRRRICLWCRLGYTEDEMPDKVIPLPVWQNVQAEAPWLARTRNDDGTICDFRADTRRWLKEQQVATGLELIDYIGSPQCAALKNLATEDFGDMVSLNLMQYKRAGTTVVYDKATSATADSLAFKAVISSLQFFGKVGAEGSLTPESDFLKTTAPVAWWLLGDELGGPPGTIPPASNNGSLLKYQNNRAALDKIMAQSENIRREVVLIVTGGPKDELQRMTWLNGFREWRRLHGVTLCANTADLAYLEQ